MILITGEAWTAHKAGSVGRSLKDMQELGSSPEEERVESKDDHLAVLPPLVRAPPQGDGYEYYQ